LAECDLSLLPARSGAKEERLKSLQKPTGRAQERRTKTAKHQANWRAVKREVMRRDRHQCRICGSRDQVDPHHVVFRSALGKDTVENVAAVCRVCHDEIHAYRLFVTGNANTPDGLTIDRP
jgi:5-methylcytosine-specific restriction endonuclease McrA